MSTLVDLQGNIESINLGFFFQKALSCALIPLKHFRLHVFLHWNSKPLLYQHTVHDFQSVFIVLEPLWRHHWFDEFVSVLYTCISCSKHTCNEHVYIKRKLFCKEMILMNGVMFCFCTQELFVEKTMFQKFAKLF